MYDVEGRLLLMRWPDLASENLSGNQARVMRLPVEQKAYQILWAADAIKQQADTIYADVHATIERVARFKARLAERAAGR